MNLGLFEGQPSAGVGVDHLHDDEIRRLEVSARPLLAVPGVHGDDVAVADRLADPCAPELLEMRAHGGHAAARLGAQEDPLRSQLPRVTPELRSYVLGEVPSIGRGTGQLVRAEVVER